jgi:hypothetical protein
VESLPCHPLSYVLILRFRGSKVKRKNIIDYGFLIIGKKE